MYYGIHAARTEEGTHPMTDKHMCLHRSGHTEAHDKGLIIKVVHIVTYALDCTISRHDGDDI
jgi:hypothetical protein